METATGWTGETACALQAALRMSNETFARHLGLSLRTVAGWHEKPEGRSRPESQQLLDAAFARADSGVRDRFAMLCGEPALHASGDVEPEALAVDKVRAAAEHRLAADPNIGQALARLDDLAAWQPGTARSQVAARITQLDRRDLLDRADRRSRIGQPAIAEALAGYYRDMAEGYGRYHACLPGGPIMTSVLTHPDWLDLECPLTAGNDRLTFTRTGDDRVAALDTTAAAAAAAASRRDADRRYPADGISAVPADRNRPR